MNDTFHQFAKEKNDNVNVQKPDKYDVACTQKE